MAAITIKSFGYGHPDGAPPAHVTVDLSTLFRDPHVFPEMRNLTGKHPKVIQSVMRQPGAEAFLQALVVMLFTACLPSSVTVAFGCVGGRHRSVVFADALAQELRARLRSGPAVRVTVEHRDINKPVLVR